MTPEPVRNAYRLTDLERLQKARDKAHEKLSRAEWEFALANRALEAAKREIRMKEQEDRK